MPSWYGNGNSGTGRHAAAPARPRLGFRRPRRSPVGVVDINTVIDYGAAEAAGTGIVLTSNGEILTNNHVIDGATSIKVTIVSTGKSYTATVVGDDPTDDVAVLQLSGASGLATAKLGDSSSVAVGNTVTAVGNAGGTGGTPSAATGTVTALNQSITATDEGGGNSENLTGMIEINADIQAGDSGGPLYSASGTVIGIDTAASSQSFNSTTTGFAIPINKALSIAKQIESGTETSTIHIGPTAFLGVELGSGGSELVRRLERRHDLRCGRRIGGAAGRPCRRRHHHGGERPDASPARPTSPPRSRVSSRARRSRSPGSTARGRATRRR